MLIILLFLGYKRVTPLGLLDNTKITLY